MSGLTPEERETLRDWWDSESEADTAGTMLADLDATVERIIADREHAARDEGVRQAIAWLQADYPYGTGPEWREQGVEWIADRLAEHRADRIKGGLA
jgi:hypothetical protein